MTKSELVKIVAEKSEITQVQAAASVECFFAAIEAAMKKGRRVELRGLGTLKVRDYDGYMGRNPKTGESVPVPPKRMPFFKQSKEIKAILNGEKQ